MMTAWSLWSDALALGSSLNANRLKIEQTATAAGVVIDHRTRAIYAALRDPLAGDYAELGRMVPEKLAALSEAATVIATDWLAMQADLFAQGRDVGLLFLGGWPLDAAALARIGERGSQLVVGMSKASGRAFAPVHKAATGNQRRLRRRTA